MADLKRRRQRWQPRKRQLPGTIEPSSFTVTDSDGAVQTAAELTDSAEESIHFASSDADDAGADTASDTGDTTTMTRTIEGVLGHDGSTKLFTVTSTSTNLDDDASASSQEARNADGSTGSDSSDSNSTHIGLIVGLVVGLTVIVLALVLLVWRRCKRSKHASKLSDEGTSESREMEQQQQQQTATSTRSAPPMPPVPGRYPPSNGAATFQRQPSSSSSSYAGTKAMSPGLQEKNSAMDSDDYMSTSYAPAALHPSAARKASRKSSATKSTNRKSWFSLKSNKTLNCHFDYFRSSRHLDHDGEDEELRDLPPPDAAVFDRCVCARFTNDMLQADTRLALSCSHTHTGQARSASSVKRRR